jgi:uncharacterized protein (TIGR01777 family)
MSLQGPVFVTGATGLLGARLCADLVGAGVEVRALSRRASGAPQRQGMRWISGDPANPGDWQRELAGVRAVVHLAGESVAARRWSQAQKRRLYDSRIESTRRIVEALGELGSRPEVLVCGSASGYFGARGEEELDESSAPGSDFLAQLCCDWEAAAQTATPLGLRVVSLRFGVVLGSGGGALARMRLPFRLGLGGPMGPPRRWFPWIHEDDALGLIRLALAGGLHGPVNAVAPGLIRQAEFARTLGRVLRRPALIPMPLGLLRLALGEMAEGLVPGQLIVPRAAEAAGYEFRYPELESALAAALSGC